MTIRDFTEPVLIQDLDSAKIFFGMRTFVLVREKTLMLLTYFTHRFDTLFFW